MLSWLDDLLLHAKSVDGLLENLKEFFFLCRENNLKIHPGNCILFASERRWCGRVLSGLGVRFDPRRTQGLLEITMPTTIAYLQQFVCALKWMRMSIPAIAQLIAPLQALI
jgi:hypothetical protein